MSLAILDFPIVSSLELTCLADGKLEIFEFLFAGALMPDPGLDEFLPFIL